MKRGRAQIMGEAVGRLDHRDAHTLVPQDQRTDQSNRAGARDQNMGVLHEAKLYTIYPF